MELNFFNKSLPGIAILNEIAAAQIKQSAFEILVE